MRKASTGLGFGALLPAALAIAIATSVPTVASADDTIKVGVLLIDSGPLAGLKETQTKAANLAI
jgi:branched-chain amino acid transport system substrate-binding protein